MIVVQCLDDPGELGVDGVLNEMEKLILNRWNGVIG